MMDPEQTASSLNHGDLLQTSDNEEHAPTDFEFPELVDAASKEQSEEIASHEREEEHDDTYNMHPKKVSMDHEEGYMEDDDAVADENRGLNTLGPRDIGIHVGKERDIVLGIHGYDSPHTSQIPSTSEAEHGLPEVQLEKGIPQPQSVTEQESSELHFESDDGSIHANDGVGDKNYIPQSQSIVEQDSHELHFEPNSDEVYLDNDVENRNIGEIRDAEGENGGHFQYGTFAVHEGDVYSDDSQRFMESSEDAAVGLEDNKAENHARPHQHFYGDSTDADDYVSNVDDDQRFMQLIRNVPQELHPHSYQGFIGVYGDDDDDYNESNIYTSTHDELNPTMEPDHHQSHHSRQLYYEGEDDDVVIINSQERENIHDDNDDSDRVFIKGILTGDVEEEYGVNIYTEDYDEDTDDVIDIRDNTNVEDQFIEYEDNSFVEGAIGGLVDSEEKQDLQEECEVDDVDVKEEKTGDNGVAEASSSRVSFADENELDREHHFGDFNTFDGKDGYRAIPGFSRENTYESYDRDHEEGEEKSLDVLLLEEICEEAASMTIKEALIHSLKPNVRAGLTTAHLRLSESEVLALEGYCEDFVGGLIKDLLKRSSSLDLESRPNKSIVTASVIKNTTKQLSTMEVQQMKIYSNHFVHNVIAESIIDSSMIVARQQYQTEQVKELLHVFQNSEELQEYFTNLTTDIVRTSLLNVTAKEDLREDCQTEQEIEAAEQEPTESMDQIGYSFEDHHSENVEDFDYDGSNTFGFPVRSTRSPEYRRSRSHESWTSDDEEGMGMNGAKQGSTTSHDRFSTPGNTTFEFDEEWAEGVFKEIGVSTEGEKRQKFVMRELEFDDRANIGGTELLAPVFLAVAEENEDDNEFEGLRRKTQSIEDLCDFIEEEKEPPRKRSSSLNQPKRKPRKKPRPSSHHEQIEELKREIITEDTPYTEPEDVSPKRSPQSISPIPSPDKPFHAYEDEQYRWHTIRVNNREKVLDLKLIEPYMKVITHGGVHMPSRAVIVVIAACYLPNKTKKNYEYLMEQLFFYLISTLELLATTDEYYLVYFNGGTTQNNQPALPWMKRFYQHVEGGLKKNMVNMFIVHPNFWLKTVVRFAKAFVGTNFWSKLLFVKSLDELSSKIPVEFIYVPDEVIRNDPKYKRMHNL